MATMVILVTMPRLIDCSGVSNDTDEDDGCSAGGEYDNDICC